MFIKVLYDEKGRRGFRTGKGFSCLIAGKILFDTGDDAESLLDNMSRMKVNIGQIKAVVVSHDHWAHTGGMWEILRKKKRCKVYGCPKFSDEFKNCVKELGSKLILSEKVTEVDKGIYVTGEVGAAYRGKYIAEQALVVKGKKGISIMTGCAHPGIVRIVKNVKRKFEKEKIYMVLGGFHIGDVERSKIEKIISDFRELKVEKAGPSHCAGDKAIRIFRGRYGKNFVQVKAGSVIEV
ncbi:MAG: MBL fold metallo-hydrolase [Candidatus Omnitrophota bacterium]|jgi:7,8-dihydropterin-6-yl-methyl-4-(beta-D-ribofuranosyl)aminobenzene 5'-phosphate synthase